MKTAPYLKRSVRVFLIIIMLWVNFPSKAQINTDQVMTIGKNAFYFEDYILSIQYFNQVIKVKPYLAEPYFLRSLAKLYLEDFRGAEEDATAAIERNKFIVDAYQVRGIARQTLNKDREAIQDYEEGLKQLPENKTFLINKAVAEQDIKDYDASEKSFDQLIKLFPKYENAYLGRAQLYMAKGDTVKALDDVNKSLDISKTNPNAYVLRAEIETTYKKDYASALKDMDEAIKLEPHYAGYFINRASLKYNQDDYFGAMADYDYAIAVDPNNVMAHFNRGLLRMEVRDNNKAIEDFSFVISRSPNDIRARYNRADLYSQTGQYKKAVADYDVVLAKVDDMPSLYYMRSEARRKSGDVSGGERDYDKSKNLIQAYRSNPKKHISAQTPEDLANAPETAEDVKNEFKTLLTIKNDNSIKPQYENKARGKIQDNNFTIDAEPQFVLSYYIIDNELKNRSNYTRELTELNDMKVLPASLAIASEVPSLSEEDINKHFNSINYYTSLISANPNRAIDYFARAMEYMMVKNYESAVADFDKAIQLSNKFTLAYFARANAKYKLLQAENMKYDDETSSKSTNTSSLMLKEKLSQRQVQDINSDLDKVIELSPNMVYAFYNKGCLYLEMQDNTSAVSAFTKALDLKPDFGEAYYNRGLVYFRLGNKENGLADLSKAGEFGITPSYSVLKRMTK